MLATPIDESLDACIVESRLCIVDAQYVIIGIVGVVVEVAYAGLVDVELAVHLRIAPLVI